MNTEIQYKAPERWIHSTPDGITEELFNTDEAKAMLNTEVAREEARRAESDLDTVEIPVVHAVRRLTSREFDSQLRKDVLDTGGYVGGRALWNHIQHR